MSTGKNQKATYLNYGIKELNEESEYLKRRREEKIENILMAALFIQAIAFLAFLLHGCVNFEGDLNASYYEGYNAAMAEAQQ